MIILHAAASTPFTRHMCSVSPFWNGSRAVTLKFYSMCELPPSAAALHFYSITAPAIRSPAQPICKDSIFAECTMQQCTEQIVWDRKSGIETKKAIGKPHQKRKKTNKKKLHSQQIVFHCTITKKLIVNFSLHFQKTLKKKF